MGHVEGNLGWRELYRHQEARVWCRILLVTAEEIVEHLSFTVTLVSSVRDQGDAFPSAVAGSCRAEWGGPFLASTNA
jgi:hypothetical protein